MENAGVLDDIVHALTSACDDYACDSRGDIGSWVRETGCEAYAVFLRCLDPDLMTWSSERTSVSIGS